MKLDVILGTCWDLIHFGGEFNKICRDDDVVGPSGALVASWQR